MRDDICDFVENFEKKAQEIYNWKEDIPAGEPCCENCKFVTYEISEEEREYLEQALYDLRKCMKMSKIATKEAEIQEGETPISIFSKVHGVCSLHKPTDLRKMT